jgi:hypothetical protein
MFLLNLTPMLYDILVNNYLYMYSNSVNTFTKNQNFKLYEKIKYNLL